MHAFMIRHNKHAFANEMRIKALSKPKNQLHLKINYSWIISVFYYSNSLEVFFKISFVEFMQL